MVGDGRPVACKRCLADPLPSCHPATLTCNRAAAEYRANRNCHGHCKRQRLCRRVILLQPI
jgi:hypothetical protein